MKKELLKLILFYIGNECMFQILHSYGYVAFILAFVETLAFAMVLHLMREEKVI